MYHIPFTWVYQKAWGSCEQQRAYFLISAINIYLLYWCPYSIPFQREYPTNSETQVKKAAAHHLTAVFKEHFLQPCKPASYFHIEATKSENKRYASLCLPNKNEHPLLTLSFDVPITTLDSLFSNRSSVFKLPAAPGNGGKLDKPNSKLGDGGFGGGGDCVWPLWNRNNMLGLLH